LSGVRVLFHKGIVLSMIFSMIEYKCLLLIG
jgi:hypothetical protein